MKTLFAALVLAAVLVAAHDKMTAPTSRSGVETVGTVCDLAYNPSTPVTVIVEAGQTMNVAWDGNHGGEFTIGLAPAALSDSLDAYTIVAIVSDVRETVITVPEDYQTGTYTLRWTWAGYVSCADINVNAVPTPDMMISPPSRTGVATETAEACDAPYNPNAEPAAEIAPGGQQVVTWQGTYGGVYTISIASASQSDNVGAFSLLTSVEDVSSTVVTIPSYYTPGMYTLRWAWEEYVSCSDIEVVDSLSSSSSSSTSLDAVNATGSAVAFAPCVLPVVAVATMAL